MSGTQHELKTKLLEATLKVVRAKGYTATRIEDVCAEAGLTKGSFFHHFKSKEDLALGAAAHWQARTSEFFATAPYHQPSDPRDQLLAYIEFRRSLLTGELPEFTCFVGTVIQEAYRTHPEVSAACEKSISGHAETLEADIRAAMRKYGVRSNWTARVWRCTCRRSFKADLSSPRRRGPPPLRRRAWITCGATSNCCFVGQAQDDRAAREADCNERPSMPLSATSNFHREVSLRIYWIKAQAPRRVLALAKHLGVNAECVETDLITGGLTTPGYVALNPNKKVPTLVDGERVLWELSAIMAYLCIKQGSDMWPTRDPDEQVEVLRWISWNDCHWAPAVAPFYFEHIVKSTFGIGSPDVESLKPKVANLRKFAEVLEGHLNGRERVAVED